MIDNIFKHIECRVCGKKGMFFSNALTTNAYTDPLLFNINDVDKLIDGYMADFIIMTCPECGNEVRITFKDLYNDIRKIITTRVLSMIASSTIVGSFNRSVDVMIYCGCCNGYDGKGGCFSSIYNDCEVKRFYNEF